MATSQPEYRAVEPAIKLLAKSVIAVIFCVGSVVRAQAQDAQPNNTNESRTETTVTSMASPNPTRRTESHAKSGNRSVDTLRVEELDLNGRYQPFSEIETETVQVNSTTTRKVVRTHLWDGNGQRNLTQVTEEEVRNAASGDTQVVRSTSNCDAYGNLQVMEREVADTTQTNPNAQETKTTFYLLDANGVLAPSLRTQELQQPGADHTVERKKTTLAPDSSGIWQVNEIKESTIKQEGKDRTSEERVWVSDSEARLSEVLRTVSKEEETIAGEKANTVEKYSTEISGVTPDGSLHLNQRVTTLQKKDSGVETTEQQIEQPNPGDPRAGLQVSAKTESIAQYGASGSQQSQILEIRDVNGSFNVVSVEARKSDQIPAE
jgi:hypothetical protein